jgi:hypothetical protein
MVTFTATAARTACTSCTSCSATFTTATARAYGSLQGRDFGE